jgi:hypothetical protein
MEETVEYKRTVRAVASAEYAWLNVPMHIPKTVEGLNSQNCISESPQGILIVKVVSEYPIKIEDAAGGNVDKIKLIFKAPAEPV